MQNIWRIASVFYAASSLEQPINKVQRRNQQAGIEEILLRLIN